MSKVAVNPQPMLYPTPVVLVGAKVKDKPNFMAAAWVGVACSRPPMLSVAIQPHRYTLIGVRQNMTLSINLPSVNQLKETDYCGLYTGEKVDKVAVSGFKVFYGKLVTAPLIEQCPVNMACKVVQIIDLGMHHLVIGQIEETFVTEDCLTGGSPDIRKIKPFTFLSHPTRSYAALGEFLGQSHSIGKELARDA